MEIVSQNEYEMEAITQCESCKYWTGTSICAAFPEGSIPHDILFNLYDHRKPFPGDHGIQWEPKIKKDGTPEIHLFDIKDDEDMDENTGGEPLN